MRVRIKNDLHRAMKNGDKLRISTIRLMLAAIKDADIAARGKSLDDNNQLSDDDIISLMATLIKGRNTSATLYEEAGRMDQAQKERDEIKIVSEFLPKQLTVDELNTAITTAMKLLDTKTIRDMGQLMKYMKREYAGRLDMALLGATVRHLLT